MKIFIIIRGILTSNISIENHLLWLTFAVSLYFFYVIDSKAFYVSHKYRSLGSYIPTPLGHLLHLKIWTEGILNNPIIKHQSIMHIWTVLYIHAPYYERF